MHMQYARDPFNDFFCFLLLYNVAVSEEIKNLGILFRFVGWVNVD